MFLITFVANHFGMKFYNFCGWQRKVLYIFLQPTFFGLLSASNKNPITRKLDLCFLLSPYIDPHCWETAEPKHQWALKSWWEVAQMDCGLSKDMRPKLKKLSPLKLRPKVICLHLFFGAFSFCNLGTMKTNKFLFGAASSPLHPVQIIYWLKRESYQNRLILNGLIML